MEQSNNSQISFSWDLHYACDYRCPYCWWDGRWQELARLDRHLSVDEWMKYWRNIHSRYGNAFIEILGGEPAIYPSFVRLIRELSGLHNIRITTNLSALNIEDFTGQIDPSKVKISPTFHPLFADFNSFIEKAILLKESGFTNNINYLAYPPQIRQIPSYKEKFMQKGLALSVMTFWGEYKGITYPDGYTDEEKNVIDLYLGKRGGEKFQLVPKRMSNERLCRAGQSYAVIQADGNVIRCGGSGLNETIGNFFDDNFQLLDKPLSCKAEYCKCNEWGSLQVDANDIISLNDARSRSEFSKFNNKNECRDSSEVFLRNKEKNSQETLQRKIILESKPLRLGIVLTDWCNLECIMCPATRHKSSFTFSAAILSKIEELFPYLEMINWQGGEFFGFKYVKNMFLSLKKYPQIRNEIITNGLLLDEEWITSLLELDAVIYFSIDSPIKEIYEYIRRGAKYDELIERLKLIIALERKYKKRLRRSITVVVMRSNYRHLTDFISFAEEFGFDSIDFKPVMFVDTQESIFRDPDFDFKYLNETMSYMKDEFAAKRGADFGFIWSLPISYDKENPEQGNLFQKSSTGLFCNLPWKSLWVSADRKGEVTSDCWCKTAAGNIFQNNLLEIWNNEIMQECRRRIIANNFSLCNKDCISGYSSAVNAKTY